MAADNDGSENDKPAGTERKSRMRRQRPPVTIDLAAERLADKGEQATDKGPVDSPEGATAEPAEAAAPSPQEEEAQPAEPERAEPVEARPGRTPWLAGASIIGSDDGWTRPALAGVAGGIVALILLIVLQAIGLVPSPGRSAALHAADQAKTTSEAVAAIDRRLSAVEMITQNQPSKNAVNTLDGEVAQLQKQMGALATRGDMTVLENKLAALAKRVDALPAGVTQDQLTALSDRVSALESGGTASGSGGVGSDAAVALSHRIDAVQSSLNALGDRLAALESKASAGPSESTVAARAIAVVALRRAVDEGAPFTTDLDLASALGLPADDVAALKPYADKGVPTKAALASEFPKVGDAIVSTTTKANLNAGWIQRLIAGARSLVTVRPTGPVAGSDPAAVVSRMQAAVEAGDLKKALSERDALPDAGKAASADWAAAAQSRVTVDGLIAKIAAHVAPAGGNGPT